MGRRPCDDCLIYSDALKRYGDDWLCETCKPDDSSENETKIGIRYDPDDEGREYRGDGCVGVPSTLETDAEEAARIRRETDLEKRRRREVLEERRRLENGEKGGCCVIL